MDQEQYEQTVESIAKEIRAEDQYPDDLPYLVERGVESSYDRRVMDDGDVLDVLSLTEWSIRDVIHIADTDESATSAVRYAATRQIEDDVREALEGERSARKA